MVAMEDRYEEKYRVQEPKYEKKEERNIELQK